MQRTPAEVGRLVAARRASRGYSQSNIPGISSALVGQIERGVAPARGRSLNRAAFMRALQWPDDALEQLAAGVDPATFLEPSSDARALTAEERLDRLEADVRRLAVQVGQILDRGEL